MFQRLVDQFEGNPIQRVSSDLWQRIVDENQRPQVNQVQAGWPIYNVQQVAMPGGTFQNFAQLANQGHHEGHHAPTNQGPCAYGPTNQGLFMPAHQGQGLYMPANQGQGHDTPAMEHQPVAQVAVSNGYVQRQVRPRFNEVQVTNHVDEAAPQPKRRRVEDAPGRQPLQEIIPYAPAGFNQAADVQVPQATVNMSQGRLVVQLGNEVRDHQAADVVEAAQRANESQVPPQIDCDDDDVFDDDSRVDEAVAAFLRGDYDDDLSGFPF